MKRILISIILALSSSAAIADDTFTMMLVREEAKPRGERNLCVYQVKNAHTYTVTIGARTPDVTCAKAIRWEESDFDYDTQGVCEYIFPSGNFAVTADSDGTTRCYKHVKVTFLRGLDV
jgi:hypothetical protein